MDGSIWPWIVLAVIVVIGVALVVVTMNRHKAEQNRARAADLRNEAAGQAGGLQEHELRAREAEAQADRKRVEAERARQEAEAARQAQAQEEALHEDRIRQADRLDPEVDHRADDYEPTTARQPEPGTGEDPTGGAHRGT